MTSVVKLYPVKCSRVQRLQLTHTRHRPDLDDTVEATSDLASGPWTPLATSSGLLAAETTVTDAIALLAGYAVFYLRRQRKNKTLEANSLHAQV